MRHYTREIPLRFGVGYANSRRRTVCATLHDHRAALRFQQAEARSARLPIDADFSRFGTVSVKAYRQALAGLSWLSSSLSQLSLQSPNPIARSGRACRHVAHSPRRPRLNEPCGIFTRSAQCKSRCGPNPLEGFVPSHRNAPPSANTALDLPNRATARPSHHDDHRRWTRCVKGVSPSPRFTQQSIG